MIKSMFWKAFKVAWTAAFSEEIIQGAWKKSGLWPINGALVIAQITRPEPLVAISLAPTTPMTSKGIRRYQRLYKTSGSISVL